MFLLAKNDKIIMVSHTVQTNFNIGSRILKVFSSKVYDQSQWESQDFKPQEFIFSRVLKMTSAIIGKFLRR